MYSRYASIFINEFFNSTSRQFHTKIRTIDRIGPHNSDVISVLVGCLLNPNLRASRANDYKQNFSFNSG
jgi:hypothetical protein